MEATSRYPAPSSVTLANPKKRVDFSSPPVTSNSLHFSSRPKADKLQNLEKGMGLSDGSDSEDEELPSETKRLLHSSGIKLSASWLLMLTSQSFLAGTAYTCSSISMILLNKLVLSGFGFDAPNALMFFQVRDPFLRLPC
jgi:hypothetical protein